MKPKRKQRMNHKNSHLFSGDVIIFSLIVIQILHQVRFLTLNVKKSQQSNRKQLLNGLSVKSLNITDTQLAQPLYQISYRLRNEIIRYHEIGIGYCHTKRNGIVL